jgi:hypothetical protein
MTEYDMSIHTNPDARAWAEFFVKTRSESDDPASFGSDVEHMQTWFANAMMAMHDHLTGQRVTVLDDGSAFFTASVGAPLNTGTKGLSE